MKQNENEYYDSKQLSVKLNIAPKTISKWTQARRIPGQVKMGGVWRYQKTAIDKALLRGCFLNPTK